MKVLFISSANVHNTSNGGELCTNRNYSSFCEILGEQNVSVLNLLEKSPEGLSNALLKRFRFLSGYYEGLKINIIKDILLKAQGYEIVFINTSTYGIIAKKLKENGYEGKVITFFHNLEYHIKVQRAKRDIKRISEIFVTRFNEKVACKYSDITIALTEKDKTDLKKLYGANEVAVLPISLRDAYKKENVREEQGSNTFLFPGNKWYANIHGIRWFIDNVLDSVDIKLLITGNNMNQLVNRNNPKIEYLGFVDDFPTLIESVDFILSPSFIGGGMKVKICESLMYGKNIIGTKEAFEGYDIDISKIGGVCDDKQEFISTINANNYPSVKFNTYARQMFLEKYSFEATLTKFKDLLI